MNHRTEPPEPRAGKSRSLLILALLVAGLLAGLAAWLLRPAAVDPSRLATTESAIVPGSRTSLLPDDALADGWNTEAFNSQASKKLKKLQDAIGAAEPDRDALRELLDESFRASSLVPESELTVRYDPPNLTVRELESGKTLPFVHEGPAGGLAAIEPLRERLAGTRDYHAKFKIIHVEILEGASPTERRVGTRAYFLASGFRERSSVQVTATWLLDWSLDTSNHLGKLESIRLEALELVETRFPTERPFSDLTESLLGSDEVFNEQLRPGIDRWLGSIESRFGLDIGGWQGLAIADVNGDDLEDLYVLQPGGLPNRLYVQRADGGYDERSREAGVDWIEASHGGLFVDLDQDGDRDLLTTTLEGVLVQTNDGSGKFSVAQAKIHASAISYSLAAADFDQDGDLDVFVTGYNPRKGVERHILFARPVPYHDANNGGRNLMLRNDGVDAGGRIRLTEVTRPVGLDQNNRRFSYAAAWEDYDGDGDLDLYVANDFGRNNLYRNDGGRFLDVAAESGVEDISPGMSACWSDYDHDGHFDLYVSNMFSSAGNRITSQSKFLDAADAATRAEFRRHSRGNTLLKNLGNGKFEDVSEAAGVTIGRWAWGSRFTDLNLDGHPDLVVTNGFITQEDTGDL